MRRRGLRTVRDRRRGIDPVARRHALLLQHIHRPGLVRRRAGRQPDLDRSAVRPERHRAPVAGRHLDVRRSALGGAVHRRAGGRACRLTEAGHVSPADSDPLRSRQGMTQPDSVVAAGAGSFPRQRLGGVRVAAVLVVGVVLTAAIVAVHTTQGTAAATPADVFAALIGQGDADAVALLLGSRAPRALAALAVGLACGAAGAGLQSVARNPLASPDTLAVNGGAYLAVVAVAAFGVSLPSFLAGGAAFVGGLAAAGLVLAVSTGGAAGPTRLILAGSVTALALHALTILLLLLFAQNTIGLLAWGQGTLVQSGMDAVTQLGPVIILGLAALVGLGHKLDVLSLGDDAATGLGLRVRRVRTSTILLAVVLSAAAVAIAGPIGFVGLCAPVIVRLLARRIPGLNRHRVLVPAAGLAGVVVVLLADVAVRAVLGPQSVMEIPTGVVTSLVGAALLTLFARHFRDSGPARSSPSAATGLRSRRRFVAVLSVCTVSAAAALILGLLLGDTLLLTGDVLNWLTDRGGTLVTYVLDQRVPRVGAALLAGAALALAGTAVQAVCRNPLAEPSLLGITGGAGVAAIALISFVQIGRASCRERAV